MPDEVSQVASDDSHVWFSPSPGTYAVIRIDAVEMVKPLKDDEALQAAKLMQTKSYLVWLHCELDLPFPDKPWYRFDVLPIGPHLPPANATKGLTSDMCIPIYPNSNHPTGRAPIHPETPFPYGNCYHWLNNNIHILVRSRVDGFDETNAVQISGKTEGFMGRTFSDDLLRAIKNRELSQHTHEVEKADDQQRDPTVKAHSAADGPSDVRSRSSIDVPQNEHPRVSASPQEEGNVDAASISSGWSNDSGQRPTTSLENIMRIDPFTGPDEDLDLVPLVDLWPDLAGNLKEEDIPSPLDLDREIETIQR
ncbi:hypothetical protein TRAPUB_2636 [Trametes pubescens]|uniref:Uncharacterized protein n=1 Tax=Trametes pubescens TaxID=154538 RepID=A0A1M2VG54_TRAPU|nr:hypothetical protein TRAPUB_2636 [Trametes pubescens]